MNKSDDIQNASEQETSWQFGGCLPTRDTLRLVEQKMAEGWELVAVAPISAENTILDIKFDNRRRAGFDVSVYQHTAIDPKNQSTTGINLYFERKIRQAVEAQAIDMQMAA